MIHIRKWWPALRLPEKVTLVVALVTFAVLLFVCSFILLAALGAPLGRLMGILGLWLLKAQIVVTGAVWIGAHLFELLRNGLDLARHYDWAKFARASGRRPTGVLSGIASLGGQ